MEANIDGQVLSVQGVQTKNGKLKYDIAFSDGNTYVTFNAETANKANGYIGQQVTAQVKVEQKGQYTNYYFNDVGPQGGLAAPAPQAQAAQTIPTVGAIPIASAPSGGMSPEREQKIVKQSSMATAFNFVGQLYQGAGPEALTEASQCALSLARDLYGNVMGAPQAVSEAPAASQAPSEEPTNVVPIRPEAPAVTPPW